jgi:hypothetical protein
MIRIHLVQHALGGLILEIVSENSVIELLPLIEVGLLEDLILAHQFDLLGKDISELNLKEPCFL